MFVLAGLAILAPAEATTRFTERSLYINSALPGVVTDYTVSLRYMSPDPVGSLDMLFCEDPIPYMPCNVPPGLDVTNAVLDSQSGETGFMIDPATHTSNHILLRRVSQPLSTTDVSRYVFKNIHNPNQPGPAFSIRLKSHSSTDGSGPLVDFGSVRSQITTPIVLETQVPPMLVFCMSRQVEIGCVNKDNVYYTDMGELRSDSTLTATSQFAVGTNASAGFSVTVHGTPPAAGTTIIDGMDTPDFSTTDQNQFGINLRENSDPREVGSDPEGLFANAVPAWGYSIPNKYKYVNGDEIAYSPNVSLMKKFTVSYILNVHRNMKAGVYTTTITFLASGRF